MSMLYACHANTSPVLAMYQDSGQTIQSLISAAKKTAPLMDFTDSWGERHEVWAVSQPEIVRPVQQVLAEQPLYIADGHHRYDSALTYKREMTAQSGSVTGEEGFNFVMISLIDFADPGLVVLPTHRLVRGIPRMVFGSLKSRLQTFFDIEELSADQPIPGPKRTH